jgi:hypothetical protein
LINRRASVLFCCVAIFVAGAGMAQTCTTQARLDPAERDSLAAQARSMTADALAANAGALKQASVAELQRDFAGVGAAVLGLREVSAGTVTVEGIFLLDNASARPTDAAVAGAAAGSGIGSGAGTAQTAALATQFFCGAYNTPQHVTFTLPGLKASRYAVVFVHVTGVADPRQITYVLQQQPDGWKLAGFVQKPMDQASHDGTWYWQHARDCVKQRQLWNASVSFLLARQLVTPAGFVDSANLDKLLAEQQAALPVDWPTDEKPLYLSVQGQQVSVTDLAPIVTGNVAGIVAKLTYSVRKAAESSVPEQDKTALQQAIAAELLRKAPELTGFLSQLVVTSNTAVPPTVYPVPRP